MANPDKDFRLIRNKFEVKNEFSQERIRIGNRFVDDFIFDDNEAADIPINALRVIFNIISIISNEQFRPQDRPKQLSLFDEEFETDNNIFASIRIRNSKISPSGSTQQVVDAYEFLARFKMGWYKSLNSKGKEIKTFGGLISTPSYDKRGYTTFLVSSYWLKKLLVIPEYNYILYNLVYNVRNNKHIIFAIWLSKIPESGTVLKLSTLNKKFGLNYKTANDFCFKFLKLARISLDIHNSLSFNYQYKGDSIFIFPYKAKITSDVLMSEDLQKTPEITKRLSYFRKRFGLQENEMKQFFHQYRNIPQTRILIEKAFKRFIKICRLKKIQSVIFQGIAFLQEIQKLVIQIYQESRTGKLIPNGYPIIL
ncbi:hypothetical protein HIO71_13890 [Chryseobacterium aquaticum]|uniref:Initiator Rep protein domain-containing protein n=3 Tax=Chryseobacterium TaxID=59732 RepID=A0A848N723_9FLAO|nr:MULTISPECIES: hypothetical protein [Chryseobacterium]AZA79661.1 hypothetical protein EG347_20315 [Chryseobacterium sp. G0186]AZB35707.1 hypothetical protein EG351_20370 [Chryseobacterium bernardetii]EFK35943.1 hypothetical protein HMPREF0204_15012 [Chryseobacterium gleum ATCC 35910]NMR35274.1 hypothetical protein [Chryseobacterium aquaticum]NRQ47288.1 hypothetical protein [Chryseobacterium sp. C-204]